MSVVIESPSGILYFAVPVKEGILVLLPKVPTALSPATPKLRAVAVLPLTAFPLFNIFPRIGILAAVTALAPFTPTTLARPTPAPTIAVSAKIPPVPAVTISNLKKSHKNVRLSFLRNVNLNF